MRSGTCSSGLSSSSAPGNVRRAAFAATLVAALTPAVAAQDWTGWRGPDRTGVAAAFTAPARWPDRPSRAWQVKVGTGHASPVISGGRVFVHSRLGEQEVVTALQLPSGGRAWQGRYDAPYEMNPAAGRHGKGPKSTPIVAEGRLYTFGISGILSAFDAGSGKLVWRRQFVKEFDASAPEFGVAMSPAVDGGLLFAHVGGSRTGALVALDTGTGAVRWMWKGDAPAYASPVVATIGGTRQVITQSRLHVVGVNVRDGSLLWRIPLTTRSDQNIVTPVVRGDVVIYSGLDRPLAAARVVRAKAGWEVEPVWQNEAVPLYMSSPVAAGGVIYGLTHRQRGQFVAVDLQSGRTLWATRGREADNAALVAAGELLLATTTEGELIVARQDRTRFDLIKRYTVAESPVWAHPVPAGSGVVIKDAESVAYWTF